LAFAGFLTTATESRADSVEVKYSADTSLDGFISRSRFVNWICYNAAESRMLMQFAADLLPLNSGKSR
jgi:hypothetical protein